MFPFNVNKLLKLPKLDGKGPLKELSLITNDVNDTIFPIDGDIVPTTPFADKSNILTNRPVHVIPLHVHTAEVGTPPEQDHPVTPLNELVLVAAATSHMASSLGVAVGAALGATVGFEVGVDVGQPEGSPEGCLEG